MTTFFSRRSCDGRRLSRNSYPQSSLSDASRGFHSRRCPRQFVGVRVSGDGQRDRGRNRGRMGRPSHQSGVHHGRSSAGTTVVN